jgi:DNA-binding NarL/FixJ family response regulator
MKQICVIIADSHPIIRAGLLYFLQKDASIVVLGETDKGIDLPGLITDHVPDILILDVVLSGMVVLEIVQSLRTKHPSLRILAISSTDGPNVLEILNSGVHGCLLKDEVPELLLIAVHKLVKSQNNWFSGSIISLLSQRRATERSAVDVGLSRREAQILSMIAHGCNNQNIADTLCLSLGTVKNYITSIYLKIQVNTRAAAVVWAWQHGLAKNDMGGDIESS